MVVSKIIYTNGIFTDPKGAAETAEHINRLTGIDTEVLHNGSTSVQTAGEIAQDVVSGIANLGWYFLGGKKPEVRNSGLLALGNAFQTWLGIQEKKEGHAQALIGRVEAHLESDLDRKVLLVFHSQGAHVGLKALKGLSHLKDRIHVVSIGGMVRIPEKMAASVVNFAHSDDPVSNYVAPLGPNGKSIGVGKGGHFASAYLDNPSFMNYLLGNGIIEKAPPLGQGRVAFPIVNPSLPIQVC